MSAIGVGGIGGGGGGGFLAARERLQADEPEAEVIGTRRQLRDQAAGCRLQSHTVHIPSSQSTQG